MALSGVSCSKRGETSGKGMLYWSSNNSDEITFARLVVQQWNRLNPDKPLRFQPVPEGQSSEEVVLAAVVGGTTPDIYSNMWQGDVELYARSGKLIALDKIPGFLEFLYQRCDTAVVKEITSTDGHIYQVPWKINPIMLIYNKKMFESIGMNNPPSTYRQFFDAAKKIKRFDPEGGYVNRWIGYSEVLVTWWQRFFDFYPLYLAASGGAPLVKNNKVVFNNKYAVEVFRFLKTLYDNGFFPRERLSARRDPFLGGDIATRFTGPWEIVHAERFKPEGFEYGFSGLPVPADSLIGRAYTYGDPKNIVIFNTCKDPARAWEFIKLMITPENDLLMLKTTTQLPRRRDLTENAGFLGYFKDNPRMMTFARQSKYVRGTDSSPVLKEIFDAISQQYEACVVYGKKTPEEAINDAAKAASLIILQ
ncbi:MAG TPA: extracellular solute-binding protein [Ignavibacteriales bacterium]|nr:extracellular solute-binding protein [Ignavibacteriales bacterium]